MIADSLQRQTHPLNLAQLHTLYYSSQQWHHPLYMNVRLWTCDITLPSLLDRQPPSHLVSCKKLKVCFRWREVPKPEGCRIARQNILSEWHILILRTGLVQKLYNLLCVCVVCCVCVCVCLCVCVCEALLTISCWVNALSGTQAGRGCASWLFQCRQNKGNLHCKISKVDKGLKGYLSANG